MGKIPSQLLKGTLEGALLLIIARGATYGYEISRQLEMQGFGAVPEGTVYPLLLKMQKKHLIAGVRYASASGPDRKYYHLTAEGKQEIAVFLRHWRQLAGAMASLMEGYDESEKR